MPMVDVVEDGVEVEVNDSIWWVFVFNIGGHNCEVFVEYWVSEWEQPADRR